MCEYVSVRTSIWVDDWVFVCVTKDWSATAAVGEGPCALARVCYNVCVCV